MRCFFARGAIRSVMGPGTGSAVRYHLMSCSAAKYGPWNISCRQRICTPFFPASSTRARCFWIIASLISWREPSCLGLEAWMSPQRMTRGMAFVLLSPDYRARWKAQSNEKSSVTIFLFTNAGTGLIIRLSRERAAGSADVRSRGLVPARSKSFREEHFVTACTGGRTPPRRSGDDSFFKEAPP